MLDATSQLMWLADLDGTLVEVNRAALEYSELCREEILGKALWECPWWGKAQGRLRTGVERAAEGALVRYEMDLQSAGSYAGTLDLSIKRVQDEAGAPLLLIEGRPVTEERFRQLILALPAAVYTTDREGRVTLFNERAAELWGRRPEIGRDRWCGSWRIYRPDGSPLPHDECPMAVALREGRSVRDQEIVVERPDGTRSHVMAHPEPLRDASGRVIGAVNMLTDITERKQADRDRALLAAIVESSDDAIVSKTLDGIITSWNAGAERILGYTAAEIVGQPVLLLIPPERHDEERLIPDRIRRGERIDHLETVRLTKSGRALDVALTISPIRGSDGRIVGASKILRDVTASKRAEADLRESEARFRIITDSAPMLVWMSDPNKRCTFFNEGWLAFTGRTAEQELGDGWAEGIHPDDLEHCLRVYSTAFDRCEPFEIEYRLRRHDGTYRWVFDRGVPRFAPDGTFLGYIGSCIDVHDRRQAETHTRYLAETGTLIERALDPEAVLQQIARLAVPGFADWCAVDLLHEDGSIAAIAIAHTDPEKVRWGWELREREPVDPDAPTGVSNVIRTGQAELYSHIPDEMLVEAARSEEHLQLMREIGFSSVIIVPMRAGSEVVGTLTFVNTESGRCFDEADLTTAEEIGRRAGAALDMARLHAALRESEARFRRLAEALPAIAYTSTGEGLPDYVNARWTEYTGLSMRADYLEDPAIAIHPDDRARVAAAWAQAKKDGEPVEVELRLRRHDGAYRWFLTRAVPIHDSDGRTVRWFGTSTDIHSQKAAEAELAERVAERTAELARSNEELDQFAYVASHDLKAPLRGIDNLATWIAEDAGPLLPEESKRHLGLLQGRIRRMERLLSDLLAYSRAGREEGAPEEVDTAELVREVVELLDMPPEIEVVVETLPTLLTPRAPLEMVFRNLIGNALKHHGRPEGRIRISAHDTDGFVTFSVEDDGPGIPTRYHERIFGLFQTLRPRDEVEGSGMGLAVVKKAIESRGGAIQVASVEGQGTTFTFTWPKHV